MDPVQISQTAHVLAENFTIWSLFLKADWVVKLVIMGLLAMSILAWTIIFEKIVLLRRLWIETQYFEKLFWSGQSLKKISHEIKKESNRGITSVFLAGMREWDHQHAPTSHNHLMTRIDRSLTTSIAKEMVHIESRLSFLATIGSVSPFIGLFGTVWGIMNSFEAIALNSDTNLAVVAPGIAEALFATALGLLTAIPAVITYNKLTVDMGNYAKRLDIFADEFSVSLLRHIEGRSS